MDREHEHSLIRKAAAGDKDAATEFIRHHQPSVYAYLLRLSGRPDLAEDICQEAFVRVLNNLHRFDYRYRFSTWLFTIAKRLYVNARQKLCPVFSTDAVQAAGVDDARARNTWAPKPALESESGEVQGNLRDALQDALMTLGEDQREIVVLFHQLDWPIALIAEHMGMPEGTIKSHLHRSRKRLRTHIEAGEHHARVMEALA